MKKPIIILCAIFLFMLGLQAQKTETIRVNWDEAANFFAKNEYKFRAYTQAKVYFKNGEVAKARFNYNYFNEMMKYIDEKGDTLVIANESDINYISTGADTFFYDNKYFEWVAGSATARLAARTTYKLVRKDKIGAFGTSTPTANIESHEAILGIRNYQLNANEVMIFVKETTYYISTINGRFTQATQKNIGKLYPDKNIAEYINQHRFNLNKEEDLIDVFVYASKPK